MRLRTLVVPLVLTLSFVLAGCAAKPIVSVRTTADFDHTFAAATGTPVSVAVWRIEESAAGAEGSGASAGGRVVPAGQLTLEERNFLADAQAGLRHAGFRVVGDAAAEAGYIMLATTETVSGMYDTYRRVPVMETTTGWSDGHHGLHPYTATTTTDYLVPERRPFVHRIVTFAAIPAGGVAEPAALSPASPAVVWRGRIASDADVIDESLPQHIANMLASWGTTATRHVKYERSETAER